MSTAKIRNAMTIDVEDYFQVSAFSSNIPREHWESLPCRIERNIDIALALLDEGNTHATFFTLGWIAERYPTVVRRIVDNGHELASHGYGHQRVSELSRNEFNEDISSAKKILEDLSGSPVIGYRAPSFSIGADNLWALDLLQEAGYQYSSSIYPVRHDHYGMPEAPRFAHYPRGKNGMLELPPTTAALLGRNIPAAGGGYFRLLPYQASRWLIRHVNQQEGKPCIFYFHPWELDPDQPRQNSISAKTRFRHYVNLKRMESRIQSLLRDFHWGRMDHIFMKANT
ncbi:MAG: XrtA system polysaccharide deacetylase [Candidatus Nitrotoga sp.]